MKKKLKSIFATCMILILLVSPGCGSTAQGWAEGMAWSAASSAVNFATQAVLLALFPSLGNTTTTTTTTETGL
jgi:hypothetical protein